MNQSINFLKNLPAAPNYLPAKWIGIASVCLVILLTGISISYAIFDYQLDQTLIQVRKERIEAAKAFQKIANAYPLFAKDKPLVEQVSDYESQLRAKQTQFAELTHATLRRPFSKYMRTLAEIVPEGLWLYRIHIDQDTKNISLSGYSMLPVFVSVLLQKIQIAEVFEDVYFDLFYVRKVIDKDYIQFEVANDRLLGPEEGEEKESEPTSEQSDTSSNEQ